MIPSPPLVPSRRRDAADDPLAACARALADVAGADVDETGLSAPALADDPVAPRRGLADAAALYRAHHDAELHRALAPRDGVARALFGALERERVEALGANCWAGVRANLETLREREARANDDLSRGTAAGGAASDGRSSGGAPSGGNPLGGDPLARVTATLLRLVRDALAGPSGRPIPPSGPGAIGDVETRIAAATAAHLPPLAASRDDQRAFAAAARALIRRLGLEHAPGQDEGDALDGAADSPAETDPDADTDADADEEAATLEGEGDPDAAEDEPTLAGEHDGEDAAAAPPTEARDEPPVAGVDPRPVLATADDGYRVWTHAFDEVVDARTLADPESLAERRAELDRYLERQGRLVRRLATRLQRVLLARQRREWQFDLDEGQLDTRRLSRLVTDPLMPLVFKGETESVFRDTTVTLLIDNSRSMIGRPILIAAACADLLARTFERCGVGVEILGFTTVELHGGRSTAAWEAAGRPPSPGRLNDVRHIVYKSADMPYRSARRRLALMLERDLLKQNVDGEALRWAASRLMRRPSERRILLVVSDGSPVDTATLTANPRDYLDRHLDAVIADIERRGAIELAAIGIGHDVARFYSHAMSVFDARGLAPAMLTHLESLFRRAA